MGRSKTIELSGFPCYVTESNVKSFVEKYTGEGSVVALKIRESKGHVRQAFAIIQFTTAKHATYMTASPNRSLPTWWFGGYDLKVREMEGDIDPKPRAFLESLDDVKLHFGCQISKERFSALWREVDVSVEFGIGMRKWRFSMRYHDKIFKLELSYENTGKIELHRPRGKSAKYLLIQVVKRNFFVALMRDISHLCFK